MREFKGKFAIVFGIWALVSVIFHIYTAYYGTFEPRIQRAVHLFLLLPLVFLIFPYKKEKRNSNPNIVDWVFTILALCPSLYLILNAETLRTRIELVTQPTNLEIILGVLLIVIVLEACRRAVSMAFSIVVLVVFGYIFIAPFLPGIFNAPSYSFNRIIELMFLGTNDGVYGFLTGISSNIIFVFIIFAAFMMKSGVGELFMDLSILVAGKYKGGPAKVSVVSSGLFGSISGSSASDIYATGSFTIPLMKKIGYPPTQAGAIEASSSAGGPMLPPIMGAGAFIMAEMTATPYASILQAAILSALIFYIGCIAMVHFDARALNIKAVSEEMRVSLKSIIKRSPLLIPFFVLVYFLFSGSSPANSAVYALVSMLIIWLIMPGNRLTVKKVMEAASYATKMGTVIASALAGAGIIVAVITQTGLSLSFSGIILQFSGGQLWATLILIAIITIILGAGIPITAAYVITATVSTAALTAYGIDLLTAHLFIFYFALLADITPPVGITAFAAANIADSPPMKTAFMAPKYAFAGFIVPFIFVYHPALLMQPSYAWYEILFTFISTIIVVVTLAAVFIGYMSRKLSIINRILLLILVLASVGGGIIINSISVGLIIIYFVWDYIKYKQDLGMETAA
ncbi:MULTISPECIES: TRAP transporter permease [Oceanobacillus]|uniref:TRAP transporter permease n=1 Tax=Oceanobacillus TaxID=182709 RepID=UPI0030DBA6CA